MSEEELIIEIKGPYSFLKNTDLPYIFEEPIADEKGIYLWTIIYEGSDLVYYVGETGESFKKRTFAHMKEYLSGNYGINDSKLLKKGKRNLIWKGLWRGKDMGKDINDFIKMQNQLFPKIIELFKLYRIFLIPLNYERKLRRRIEWELFNMLKNQSGVIGNFQEPDTRYLKYRIDRDPIKIIIKNDSNILGLTDEFIIED